MKKLVTYSRKKKQGDGDGSNTTTVVRAVSPPAEEPSRKRGLLAFFSRAGGGGKGERSAEATPSATPGQEEEEEEKERVKQRGKATRRMHEQQEEDDGEDDGEGEEEEGGRGAEQMYLTERVERCPTCRMRYSRGVAQDEQLHARHCKRFKVGVKWPLSARAEVLQSFPDGSQLVCTQSSCAALRDAIEVVDTELGFADDEEGGPGDHLKQTVYMFLTEKRRVVGMVVVVSIERGYRIVTTPAHDEDEHGPAHFVCSRDVEKASIGISRIWVHRDHRRRGIGQRLLDAVQKRTGVEKELFAFSQPTMMGAALARAWFGRKDFLLMKE